MAKNISTVTPEVLEDLRKNGHPIELIDVRTPAEYRECHATPARNVPFDSLDPTTIMASRNGSHKAPLYIICQSGTRAQKACEKFYTLGHTQIVNVVGGTQAWQEGDCQ